MFGRVTGWGQEGPLAKTAGHDIDYIALTGALHAIGAKDAPAPPLNLLGDFGGGAMALAFGVVCALWEARASGRGQVVDAAMTDGVALMMAMTYSLKAKGLWRDERQANVLALALAVGGRLFAAMKRSLGVGEWIRRGLGVAVLIAVVAIAFGFDTGFLTRVSLSGTASLEQSLIDRISPASRSAGASPQPSTVTTDGPAMATKAKPGAQYVNSRRRRRFPVAVGSRGVAQFRAADA